MHAAISCEHAVFTSAPSPMGRGYRIVAASPGLRAEEKKEIIAAAPSHGSLGDPSDQGMGLMSFTLASGRQCVVLARNAGAEHSARGGARIHVDVLVLERDDFAAAGANPGAITQAAAAVLDTALPRGATPRTERLALEVRPTGGVPGGDVERAVAVLGVLLSQERLVIGGGRDLSALVGRALHGCPLGVRTGLSLSCGIKFSPARPLQFVFLSAARSDLERVAREHAVSTWCVAEPPPNGAGPWEPWLRFCRRQWGAGQAAAVAELTYRLTQDVTGAAVAQVAQLCEAMEQVPGADADTLAVLARGHAEFRPRSEVQRRLLTGLQAAIEQRRAALAEAEAAHAQPAVAHDAGGGPGARRCADV